MDDASSSERDVLRRLEGRLRDATDAAERLIAEAAAGAAGFGHGGAADSAGPPPNGWQAARDDAGARDDMALLAEVVARMRDLVPAELQRRIAEALRELLLAVRALIDWYLDRLERRRAEPVEVTDIPIL